MQIFLNGVKTMKYYVLSGVYNDPAPDAEKAASLLEGHKAFVAEGVRRGDVLFGGPRASGVSGMIIVRAESDEALQAYINTDPMVLGGVQHYDITEILPMEHQEYLAPWLEQR